VRAAVTLTVALAVLPAQAPGPAASPVGADCAAQAATHVLVRKDVFVRLDAAEQNLTKAEAALKQAQADLVALKAAADELQRQKGALLEHQARLVEHADQMREAYAACAGTGTSVVHAATDALGATWEAVDAPLGFAAGAGMCVGIAWGLTQATR
jgi:uncharacterized protein involved in exopolysaccharide biosynthesis